MDTIFLQKAEETFSSFINWVKENKMGIILFEQPGIFAFVCENKPASWEKPWMPLRVILSAHEIIDKNVLEQITLKEREVSQGKPARSVVLCQRFDHAALMLKPKNIAFYFWNSAAEKWIPDSDCWSDPVFDEFISFQTSSV